jgi:hypothetical protein
MNFFIANFFEIFKFMIFRFTPLSFIFMGMAVGVLEISQLYPFPYSTLVVFFSGIYRLLLHQCIFYFGFGSR